MIDEKRLKDQLLIMKFVCERYQETGEGVTHAEILKLLGFPEEEIKEEDYNRIFSLSPKIKEVLLEKGFEAIEILLKEGVNLNRIN